ncbi:minor capsid protein [Cyanobium sp. LEGE 06143]|uniref:minor capsid protein n=1 Tax=Cyanobium sp. LEGE 06143 TaxID=945727 RepID=UPI001882CF33|nr:minor capsid protein [Cyanobium sp. LEGE 06143]MBE9172877.1 minor capsid protein [Cyanobium sp. LEGE 06143]
MARQLQALLPQAAPDEPDLYEKGFEKLLRESTKLGTALGESLLPQGGGGPRVSALAVGVPLESAVAMARESRRYLQRHGEEFANTAAELLTSGILEGRSNQEIERVLRSRLDVVKNAAEVIVRTESIRAYSAARHDRFKAAGIDYVQYWATADDRTCPICRPRAGLKYRVGELQLPVHPRCRCTSTPWVEKIARAHRKEVLSEE